MTVFSTPFITTLVADRRVRTAALALYYLATLWGMLALYGLREFKPMTFVYQGF